MLPDLEATVGPRLDDGASGADGYNFAVDKPLPIGSVLSF